MMLGMDCCLTANTYLYWALRVTTNRAAASRPSRMAAEATSDRARSTLRAGEAPDIRDGGLAVVSDDLEEARAARVGTVRDLVGERDRRRGRPDAARKSLAARGTLLVLIGNAPPGACWGDEPGPRRAYQGEAAGRVLGEEERSGSHQGSISISGSSSGSGSGSGIRECSTCKGPSAASGFQISVS